MAKTQFAYKVNRVTISGTSFAGSEIWSTSFYTGKTGGDAAPATQAQADAIRTAWTTFFTSTGVKFGTNWATNDVKVAELDILGKTNMDTVIHAPFGTAIIGNYGSNVMPPQVSLVATLQSAKPRGLASKGRMYLPGIALGIGTNGQISTTDAQTVATAMKTFWDAVNSAVGPDYVILASQGKTSVGADGKPSHVDGTAVNEKVTRVRIGTVYDTQRRRRNALQEQYLSSTLA